MKTGVLFGLILLAAGSAAESGWRSEGPYCGMINGLAIDPVHLHLIGPAGHF
jgi:hypothetical protein